MLLLYTVLLTPVIIVLFGVTVVAADIFLNKGTKKENDAYAKDLYGSEEPKD